LFIKEDLIVTGKSKIKIIKKSERNKGNVTGDSLKSKRVAARNMVSTVGDWVSDFKARKRDETKAAFDQLFTSRHQPNES
jgi:hypothetical protein